MISLSNLLSGQTLAQVTSTIAGLLQAAGFPTTAWGPFNVGRAFAELVARIGSDQSSTIAKIAALGFASLSGGDWLTLVANQMYGLDRYPATFTQGILTLSDVAGVGPISIPAFSTFAIANAVDANGAPLRFQLLQGNLGGTPGSSANVPLNGSVQALFQAEFAGGAYNVPNGAILSLASPIPGIAVTNAGGVTSWITQSGQDEEGDPSLQARCMGQLPLLGMGPELQYDAWARAASSLVTRTKVYEGSPNPWQVQLFLAGAIGIVDSSVVTAVQNFVDPSLASLAASATLLKRRPLCTQLTAQSATAHPITLGGTCSLPTKYAAAAQANAIANLVSLQAALDIGAKVTVADLYEAIVDGARSAGAPYGTVSMNLTAPANDVVTAAGEIGVISLNDGITSFAWVGT